MKSKDFEVIVDHDASLNYEAKKRHFLLLVMWVLTIWVMFKKAVLGLIGVRPKINTFWFDGLSTPCRKIKEGAGSWQALDIIYNFQFGQQNGIGTKVNDYWLKIINAQAVRNRLRLVRRELIRAIREVAQREKEVRVFSIASGSAQAVIESMIEVSQEGLEVKAVFLDLDPTALEYGREMARRYGLEHKITFVKESTRNLEKAVNRERPHIIETIGFLDYLPHTKAVQLIERIHKLLLPGGKFLTANMCPNPERYFMKWIINWSMIYRKPKELGHIVTEGGFDAERLQIICEPLQLHAVAICQN